MLFNFFVDSSFCSDLCFFSLIIRGGEKLVESLGELKKKIFIDILYFCFFVVLDNLVYIRREIVIIYIIVKIFWVVCLKLVIDLVVWKGMGRI